MPHDNITAVSNPCKTSPPELYVNVLVPLDPLSAVLVQYREVRYCTVAPRITNHDGFLSTGVMRSLRGKMHCILSVEDGYI